jgi:P4 family phage/plasmid primase-like protien
MEQPKLYCRICKKETLPLGVPDDIGTQFYKCINGHQDTVALSHEQKILNDAYEIQAEQNDDKTYVDPLNPMASFCDCKGVFKPALVAQYLKYSEHFKTDRKTGLLYFYDGKKWQIDLNGESYLKEQVAQLLGEENNEARFRNIKHCLESITLEDIKWSNKIAVENGLLNPETGTLTSFTPNEFTRFQLPVTFDPEGTCPNIDKFFSEVLEADQIPIIEEIIGYCLIQSYPIHVSPVLLGEGANGKSTTLNLINALLSPENCSHATLQQLCCEGTFEIAQLYGKLANICDDLPGNSLRSVGAFKNLTGNAPIQARFLYQNSFTFLNTAKMLWACNKLPSASEDTIAYYRRFIILNFNRQFTGEKADINLLKKLTTATELTGLLNRALKGVKRLQSGQFSNAKSIEETRAQYIRTADSCQAYLEEQTEISTDPNDYTTEENLYRDYIAYCNTFKLPIQKKGNQTIAVQKHRSEAQRSQKTINNKRVRVWEYLKIKDAAQPAQDAQPLLPNYVLKSKNKESRNGCAGRATCAGYEIPSFYVKEVPAGEKCDCGKYAVTFEIAIPSNDVIRRCSDCLKDLKAKFSDADWKQAYPELCEVLT